MKIQICFLLEKIFRSVFSENIDLLIFKKRVLVIDCKFWSQRSIKHVNQLKNILTKHANMAYINWEQDHYKIKHILTKIHAMNSSTCQFINKLKKNKKNENTYLHECTLQWKNTLEIKEIFTSLLTKKKFLKPRLPERL